MPLRAPRRAAVGPGARRAPRRCALAHLHALLCIHAAARACAPLHCDIRSAGPVHAARALSALRRARRRCALRRCAARAALCRARRCGARGRRGADRAEPRGCRGALRTRRARAPRVDGRRRCAAPPRARRADVLLGACAAPRAGCARLTRRATARLACVGYASRAGPAPLTGADRDPGQFEHDPAEVERRRAVFWMVFHFDTWKASLTLLWSPLY
jgi:hypothetical protein